MATESTNVIASNQNGEQATTEPNVKEYCEYLKARFNEVVDLCCRLSKLDKNVELEFENGIKLRKKHIPTIKSQFVKELMKVKKLSNNGKRSSNKREVNGASNTGFKLPHIVDDNLRNFFANADLGSAYFVTERDEKGNPTAWKKGDALNQYIPMLIEHGITSRALLAALFDIYIRIHNIQDPTNRQYMKATPEMMQYLGEVFTALHDEDIKTPRTQKVKNSVVTLPPFDPKHFHYPRFQSIVSKCQIPKSSLSEDEKKDLESEEVISRVNEEQRIVSDTLSRYRSMRLAEKEKTKKRPTK